jgi:hypothetical protein
MIITCPRCGHVGKTKTAPKPGSTIHCPTCKLTFRMADLPSPNPAKSAPSTAGAGYRDSCEEAPSSSIRAAVATMVRRPRAVHKRLQRVGVSSLARRRIAARTAIGIGAAVFVLVLCITGGRRQFADRIDWTNYQLIKRGMTEAEVENILGKGEEQFSSKVVIPGQSFTGPGGANLSVSGMSTSMKLLTWSKDTKSISVGLLNGKVEEKEQSGLRPGEPHKPSWEEWRAGE